MKHAEESQFAIVVCLCVSLFTAGLSYTIQCTRQFDCLKSNTCRDFGDGSCSFQNIVTVAGYRMFNMSSDADALAALTRGVCAAGERQTLDDRGSLTCVRAPAWPTAYNAEAADPDGASEHQKNCGKWIRSGSTPATVEYFSFYDEDEVVADLTSELKAFNPLIVNDDVGRFRTACERMIVNSAFAPAAAAAYSHLKVELGTTLDSNTKILQAVGVLASHYCDAPITLGVSFTSSVTFGVTAVGGPTLGSEAASEALYAMGEPSDVREKMRAFISEMSSAPVSLMATPTSTQLNQIVIGATQNTWLDDSNTISGPYTIILDGTLDALQRFLYALEETDFEHARAYLLASAAQCSFAIRSAVTGEFGSSLSVHSETERIARRRGSKAVGLGRLHFDANNVDRFTPVEPWVMLDASTITWSRLSYHATLQTASTRQAADACWDSTFMSFPDQLDEMVLEKLTSSRLQARLEPMVDVLKEAVAVQIQSGRMAELVADPAERTRLAAAARSVQFKIAGAARGSFFGRSGEWDRPAIRSEDGALLMLLKQAKAVFLDRIDLALANGDLCDHPPLFASSTRNAYLLTLAPCAQLLPGILVAPFASDRYDEKSLYSRIGWIMAHEIAHVASDPSIWDTAAAYRLLVNYTLSTWPEAAADLTAADAVIATAKATPEELCADVSQIWCAREPHEHEHSDSSSHPPPNLRGDYLCAFVK